MFCREHVAQLREHEEAFRAAGARVAAVGLGDREYARAFREETGIGFPLLIDEERQEPRPAGGAPPAPPRAEPVSARWQLRIRAGRRGPVRARERDVRGQRVTGGVAGSGAGSVAVCSS
ncbi:MAG: redoxin domain-containing protein [Deltaproteobacteria bacterium]|nr:MAG: redoxin domain-containing protein [Deltaproteobacteria bacterium]